MKSLILLCTTILFVISASAQQVVVRGTVTDDKGSAIVGASVRVANTRYGAYSKSKGAFEIKLPSAMDATLVVSMIG